MTLSIQSFDERKINKNLSKIIFDEYLNIKNYVDNECIQSNNCEYELKAILIHEGTIDFGKYYTILQFQKDNLWYRFSDSKVLKFGNDINDIKNAYSLIYINKNI